MNVKLPAIMLGLACFGATAAKADWEYTKWGMTPEQVVSASNRLAKAGSDLRPDSDGNVSKLVAPYKSGTFVFQAEFGFDAGDRLSSVTLVLEDPSASMDMDDMDMQMGADMHSANKGSCQDLHNSVNSTYGRAEGGGTADMLYSIETWQDRKNKNNIKYTVLYGTGCYVQYSVIKSAGAQ